MHRDLLVSDRLYAALLHLYPRKYHAAYGQQMRQTFGDACRNTYLQSGYGGLLALWLPTLLDLFRSALEERARQGELTMSNSRLAAAAGPLTMLVGAVWLVASLGDLVVRIGVGGDEAFWDMFVPLLSLPFFLSFIPLFFALLGTRLRFHPSAGGLGRAGLALSVAGCAGVIVSILAALFVRGPLPVVVGPPAWVRYLGLVGFLSIRGGYLLFGVEALKTRPLLRWNWLPLLVGATVALSLPFEWFGAPALLPVEWVTPFLHFAFSGAGWVLLGLALMDPRRQPHSAAAQL